jgi:RiboL-PSP-HEPN
MASSDVDRIHREFTELVAFLAEQGEISMQSAADDAFRRVLIISAASYFEHELTNIVTAFVDEVASSDALVTALVRNKAVSRQYHTWFSWDEKNANRFFALFGDEFKTHMRDVIKGSRSLEQAIKAFLELGDGRNRLAHQNFAAFALEKTSEEIYRLYQDALPFIHSVRDELRACSMKLRSVPAVRTPEANAPGAGLQE